ncbi:MAG: Uma2 family endonuclease [Gammaproteobacteria bacterium]|nr:Uma2 family endonuclease [Gammaproteobacteria bacterium]
MNDAKYRIEDREQYFAEGLLIRLQPALCPTEDQFFEFCRINSDLRIERNADGGVLVMEPAGWDTGDRNAELTCQLRNWANKDGTGRAVGSSAGYRLPNEAIRSPDASWVRNERLATVTAEERTKFLPLCPDFAVELRSPTDRFRRLQEKMAEYIANGAELGWLIDPLRRQVLVYRPGMDAELIDAPQSVSADPVLPGFRLRMKRIW